MRIHRSKHPISHTYTLGEAELCVVPSQAYLGVEIQERLSWKPHIQAVAPKAGIGPLVSWGETWASVLQTSNN